MIKYLKIIKKEFWAPFEALIVYYPVSVIGTYMRRFYWSRFSSFANLKYIGRGAYITSHDKIVIGTNFVLEDNSIIANADSYGLYIGNFVGIARGSYLRTANHSLEDIDKPWMKQGHTAKMIDYKNEQYSIILEDDVWIGANAIILSGAYIGKGSVISAGSVVSSVIPPYSIVAGNPARVVKSRLKI